MSCEAVAVDNETLKACENPIDSYAYNFTANLVQTPVRQNEWSSLKQGAATSPSLSSSVIVLMMGTLGTLGSLVAQHLAGLSGVSTVIFLNRRYSVEANHEQG